jgi:hypothetical protein
VEDNGIGREASQKRKGNESLKGRSFGLELTEKRIRLMGTAKLFNPVNIEDLKDQFNCVVGTRVNLLIPISRI